MPVYLHFIRYLGLLATDHSVLYLCSNQSIQYATYANTTFTVERDIIIKVVKLVKWTKVKSNERPNKIIFPAYGLL